MRIEFARKIYNYVLCGMLGGLISAFAYQILISNYFSKELMSKTALENKFYLGLLGAIIGTLLGFSPNFLEGKKRSSLKIGLKDGLKGASLGLIFGTFAFPIAEISHIFLKEYFDSSLGNMASRVIVLAIFGSLIGIGVGWALSINGGAKWFHAVSGGLFGGAVSGLIIELILNWLKKTLIPNNVQLISIIAFIIMGAIILFFIAFFIISLSNAYLIGLKGSGKFTGAIFPLSKFHFPEKALIGSSPKSHIQILDAEEKHASIWLTNKCAVLKNLAKVGITLVNENSVSDEIELQGGEEITIGRVRFQYIKNTMIPNGKKDFPTSRIKIID